jgi:alkanesulfonate monooxygenase SsuD/methylene tetrahydromethanopterin reductase-like flavin-dependent oxidoreductase (luciferase family)
MRRAALLGDAWYPTSGNPEFPLDTPERLSEQLARLRRYAEEAGRDTAEVGVAYNAGMPDDRRARLTAEGRRRSFTGTPEQIADDIRTFERIGVRHLLLGFRGSTLVETLAGMERFATRVVPLVSG